MNTLLEVKRMCYKINSDGKFCKGTIVMVKNGVGTCNKCFKKLVEARCSKVLDATQILTPIERKRMHIRSNMASAERMLDRILSK